MIPTSLRIRILTSFAIVISVLAVMIALLGYFIINRDIIERAESTVIRDLQSARLLYAEEIRRIGETLGHISDYDNPNFLLSQTGLHFIDSIGPEEVPGCSSDIVKTAFEKKQGLGGTCIMDVAELKAVGVPLSKTCLIGIRPTPRARPVAGTALQGMLVKEYALPFLDDNGQVQRILYGGRVITRDFEFVDRIRNLVFGNELYKNKPLGTVTIFQDGVRVATNVLDENGQRAIGTQVSEEVYKQVVEKGRVWHDRAFVVTDWYKTAYEPIRDIRGRILGILYVGILEQPFNDMAAKILMLFLIIVCGATLLAVLLSWILAVAISRPLTQIGNAIGRLSEGDLGYEIGLNTDVKELNAVAHAFNVMSSALKQREESLCISNEKLVAANKSYVDLLGFVAHELKGMLASAVMNTYSVRDGFLGMINFKQRKAIDSVARNLDYLTNIVQRFLNLGRIERGELTVNKTTFSLWNDVFKVSLNSLITLAERKGLHIECHMDPDPVVVADLDLMQIIANNLISNAIKYCHPQGQVALYAREENNLVRIEVYNDSTPISEEQKARLFQKFSRLDTSETKREKGTGLGLFITHQAVVAHGGRIWVEARPRGNAFIVEIAKGA